MRANINPNVASVRPSSMDLVREVSIKPQDLPPNSFSRADLVFEGIDHSDESFKALIYFNNPKANYRTGRSAEKGYVGSFSIFGHGRCFGAPGHCDVPNRSPRHGDLREPHTLTPLQKRVVVTAALRWPSKRTPTDSPASRWCRCNGRKRASRGASQRRSSCGSARSR
jgi:hypothetical protein